MEIERKFRIYEIPFSLSGYQSITIQQAYLCTEPVVRIRRQDDSCLLTYKSKGLLSREEYNLPLNHEAYEHLLTKADGTVITKKRVLIPAEGGLTIELDLFEAPFAPLMLAEVEFCSEEAAHSFEPPDWFGEEVTYSPEFQNSSMSQNGPPV